MDSSRSALHTNHVLLYSVRTKHDIPQMVEALIFVVRFEFALVILHYSQIFSYSKTLLCSPLSNSLCTRFSVGRENSGPLLIHFFGSFLQSPSLLPCTSDTHSLYVNSFTSNHTDLESELPDLPSTPLLFTPVSPLVLGPELPVTSVIFKPGLLETLQNS